MPMPALPASRSLKVFSISVLFGAATGCQGDAHSSADEGGYGLISDENKCDCDVGDYVFAALRGSDQEDLSLDGGLSSEGDTDDDVLHSVWL